MKNEITPEDRNAIDFWKGLISLSPNVTRDEAIEQIIGAAEWGILHAREIARPGMIAAIEAYQKEHVLQAERIKELEKELLMYSEIRHHEPDDRPKETLLLRIKELEAELVIQNGLREIIKRQETSHEQDQSEIARLKDQIETLQKENEGWDQQAQEVERLREENKKLDEIIDEQRRKYARQSPSSAKDTPDSEYKRLIKEQETRVANELKSSPVSVDINREFVEALQFIAIHPHRNDPLEAYFEMQSIAKGALSKASPPKQSGE